MSYPLATARAIAEKIIADISPYCVRCDIAGSIRREKSEVKDIEIVCIPKFEDVPGPVDLFGEKKLVANVLQQHLQAKDTVRWIKPGTSIIEDWPLKPDAKYWRGLMPNGIKIDIFLARPENYGMIYLMRTGSAEFNVGFFTLIKMTGLQAHAGQLWERKGRGLVHLTTPDEKTVFALGGIAWVEPRERRGMDDARLTDDALVDLLVEAAIAEIPPDPKPATDWNAVAQTSPFVAAAPLPDAQRQTPFNADYADLSGECYPVEVLEDSPTQVRLRAVAAWPAGWSRLGWFPKLFLC